MIAAQFNEQTIDIHGGGQDLRFPHHDAECAQSHCAIGKPLANYWLHNGLLTVNSEKMSKSRGNVILLKDLLDRFPGESVRYLFLQSHYSSPMNFTIEKLTSAHKTLDRLYEVLYRNDELNYPEIVDTPTEVINSLSNDLNTSSALAHLQILADRVESGQNAPVAKAQLIKSGQLLGLFGQTPHQWRTFGVDKEWVEQLIAERQASRRNRNYERADEIRQQLLEAGIMLADGIHGTEWRKV